MEPNQQPDQPTPSIKPTRSEPLENYANRVGIRFAIPVGVLIAALIFWVNRDQEMVSANSDIRSFGLISFFCLIPISLVVSAWAYLLGVRAWNVRADPDRQRRWSWLTVVPISITYMIFTTAMILYALYALDAAFHSLELIRIQACAVGGAIVAAIAFWIAKDAVRIRSSRLLSILTIVVAGGVILTMTSIKDQAWWKMSFSYLGTLESNVNWIFNSTLVFTGVLLLIWVGYYMSGYRVLVRHGLVSRKWAWGIRLALTWLAIAIMIVGLFKAHLSHFSSFMHNTAAYSLAATFGVLMIGSRWYAPGFPKEFGIMSWTLVGLLGGTLVWGAMGKVNTVGIEVVAFSLGMLWLNQLANLTENMAGELEPVVIGEI